MEMRIACPRRQFQFWLGISAIDLWRKRACPGRIIHACTPAILRAIDARISLVQFLEKAIDAPLAERNAPLRRQVGFDARAAGDAFAQRDQARHFLLEALHAYWEGIAQGL